MITYNIYPKYQKCIHKLVWKCVKRSRFSFDELLSEANLGFIKAVDTYDESKACFHTHLYTTVNGALQNYCNQIDRFNAFYPHINLTIVSKTPNPEQEYSFKNLIESLSKEAREVVETVFNTPSEMIELIKTMSSNRQGHVHLRRSNLKQYFRNKGWSHKLINLVFLEIKSIL